MNIDKILDNFYLVVKKHYLGNGAYSRYLWQNAEGTRKMGINEYGCADAMNILYTLQKFPVGKEREECLNALLSLQNPETGLFNEETHHYLHTTAHCSAAIELFDAKPIYKPVALNEYFTKEGFVKLADGIRWVEAPWRDSHEVAGIYVIGIMTDSVDAQWQEHYFKYLYDNTDPEYGMSKKGTLKDEICPLFHHLNGWFHYMFNMQYAKKPLKYPDKLVDTCLMLYKEKRLDHTGDNLKFGRGFGFSEIDWVYALNRATRETPHRFYEAKEAIKEFADGFINYLESVDYETNEGANDLHCLFGCICALAELQNALPGYVESTVPLRLVLDRRPFI